MQHVFMYVLRLNTPLYYIYGTAVVFIILSLNKVLNIYLSPMFGTVESLLRIDARYSPIEPGHKQHRVKLGSCCLMINDREIIEGFFTRP